MRSDLIWKSDKTRREWEKKIWLISKLVSRLEVDSVERNVRKCAWKVVSADQLNNFRSECKARSLVVIPGSWRGEDAKFTHYSTSGKQSVMCAVGRSARSVHEFLAAFKKNDHKKQGELLGYPRCCQDEFCKNWAAGFFDPILQAALNTPHAKTVLKNEISIMAHPWSNPALRYIGLRVGFHIPCSFYCRATVRRMRKIKGLATKKDAKDWHGLEHLLGLPATLEMWRGDLVVTNSIFKFRSSTVPTKNNYKININFEK